MRQATGEQFYISDAAYWAPYILPLTRGNCRANPISITGLLKERSVGLRHRTTASARGAHQPGFERAFGDRTVQ